MPAENGDWLEGENPFAAYDEKKTGSAKQDNQAEALKFAQLYHATFTGGSGKVLLDHWLKLVRQRKIAPNASLGELAYQNGLREFVEGIVQQCEFAARGGQLEFRER